jgi:hypothetical protein
MARPDAQAAGSTLTLASDRTAARGPRGGIPSRGIPVPWRRSASIATAVRHRRIAKLAEPSLFSSANLFAKRADTNSGACNLFPATLPKKKTNLM